MFHPVPVGKRTRYSYAKIKEVMEMPHLLDIQRKSYEWFIGDVEKGTKGAGLMEIFEDISPITDFQNKIELRLLDYSLGEPKYGLEESKERDATYAAPLRVKVRRINKENGEFHDSEIFMGDFPLMTRSPSSYLSSPPITFRRVVFPDPLAPSTATNSLSRKFRLTPAKAR